MVGLEVGGQESEAGQEEHGGTWQCQSLPLEVTHCIGKTVEMSSCNFTGPRRLFSSCLTTPSSYSQSREIGGAFYAQPRASSVQFKRVCVAIAKIQPGPQAGHTPPNHSPSCFVCILFLR
jgi:hypothetical protein